MLYSGWEPGSSGVRVAAGFRAPEPFWQSPHRNCTPARADSGSLQERVWEEAAAFHGGAGKRVDARAESKGPVRGGEGGDSVDPVRREGRKLLSDSL